jgi:hypothetical protein
MPITYVCFFHFDKIVLIQLLKLSIAGDRVSFGSTKGSMVETLIYENPHSDEGTSATPSGWNKTNVSVKSKNLRSVIGSVPESLPEETVALLR